MNGGNVMVNYGLENKVVLITGANNPEGIGASTALLFAEQKAKIAILYKKIPQPYDDAKVGNMGLDRYFKANSGDTSFVEERLSELNADFIVIEGDISNEDSIKYTFDKIEERFGAVDILVNNATEADPYGNDTIETLNQKVIDDTFAVNVRGTLLMIAEFVKRQKNGGRIVNLSTDAAQVMLHQVTYGGSKATTEAFTRSIAMEVGKYGITVNCVAPGPTQTGWIDEALEKAVVPDIPIGRLIYPKEIAEAILFLASDKASAITGQVIKVSGGHSL